MERLETNEPQVFAELIDGEVVAINLESGCYYSMQGSAALIWGFLAAGHSVGETVTELATRFTGGGEELEPQTCRLRSELINEGLLRARNRDDGIAVPAQAPGNVLLPFEAPRLEKFTDMEDLLVLDPVHDVDVQGWPRLPPAVE